MNLSLKTQRFQDIAQCTATECQGWKNPPPSVSSVNLRRWDLKKESQNLKGEGTAPPDQTCGGVSHDKKRAVQEEFSGTLYPYLTMFYETGLNGLFQSKILKKSLFSIKFKKYFQMMPFKSSKGNSLVVQWLGLCTLSAKDMGSNPSRGINIP